MEKQSKEQTQQLEIEKTAILEYLDVVKSEYENERNKKQSFENRAGIIMALMGTISIFLLEKIQLNNILAIINSPLTFISLIKIISGIIVYIAFLVTIICLIKTIIVQQQNNFEVKNIDESLLGESRDMALCRIIITYRDIILQHRDLNEKRAKTFKFSLYGILTTIISSIIYMIFL